MIRTTPRIRDMVAGRKRPIGVIAAEPIEAQIHVVRGKRVMLDSDLARLYGVETRRLNEQVRRNRGRFPADFIFHLENQDVMDLMSQFATSSGRANSHGGRRKPALAFTEHGAIMAATVLNTQRAMDVSVYVVRAFINLRGSLQLHKDLSRKLADLESKVRGHDTAIGNLFDAIRELMAPPRPGKKRSIGFAPWRED